MNINHPANLDEEIDIIKEELREWLGAPENANPYIQALIEVAAEMEAATGMPDLFIDRAIGALGKATGADIHDEQPSCA